MKFVKNVNVLGASRVPASVHNMNQLIWCMRSQEAASVGSLKNEIRLATAAVVAAAAAAESVPSHISKTGSN